MGLEVSVAEWDRIVKLVRAILADRQQAAQLHSSTIRTLFPSFISFQLIPTSLPSTKPHVLSLSLESKHENKLKSKILKMKNKE